MESFTTLLKLLAPPVVFCLLSAGAFSLHHELQQRKVDRVMTEYWFFMRSQLEKLKSSGGADARADTILKIANNYERFA